MQTWWSTEMLTTDASLNPLTTSVESPPGKNSRPVMNVE